MGIATEGAQDVKAKWTRLHFHAPQGDKRTWKGQRRPGGRGETMRLLHRRILSRYHRGGVIEGMSHPHRGGTSHRAGMGIEMIKLSLNVEGLEMTIRKTTRQKSQLRQDKKRSLFPQRGGTVTEGGTA